MRYKFFTILLLLSIIICLVVVFIKTNKTPPPPKQIITIPDSEALQTNKFEFNIYYTRWCSWSQKALPDFTKLKDWMDKKTDNKIGKNTIHVHLFDVEKKDYQKDTLDKIKRDVKEIGINSYPTIVLFNGNTKLIEQYDGERKLSKYKELLTNL